MSFVLIIQIIIKRTAIPKTPTFSFPLLFLYLDVMLLFLPVNVKKFLINDLPTPYLI